jgi:hypothetical protein
LIEHRVAQVEEQIASFRERLRNLPNDSDRYAESVEQVSKVAAETHALATRDGWEADRLPHKQLEWLLNEIGDAARSLAADAPQRWADEAAVERLVLALVNLGADLICKLPKQGSDVRIPIFSVIRELLAGFDLYVGIAAKAQQRADELIAGCGDERKPRLKEFFSRAFKGTAAED